MYLWKREECKNTDPSLDACEKYTSTFETAGIPAIIGLCLFFFLSIVLFVIVRKRRKQQHAEEVAKHKAIDDGMELDFAEALNHRVYKEQHAPGLEHTFQEPPPKYN